MSNCIYCVETDQYTCNEEDGSRICKDGWQGDNCETGFGEIKSFLQDSLHELLKM